MREPIPGADRHDAKSGIRKGRGKNRISHKWMFRSNKHRPALAYGASDCRSILERVVARNGRSQQRHCRNPAEYTPKLWRADLDRYHGAARLAAQFRLSAAVSREHAETATNNRQGQRIQPLCAASDSANHGPGKGSVPRSVV